MPRRSVGCGPWPTWYMLAGMKIHRSQWMGAVLAAVGLCVGAAGLADDAPASSYDSALAQRLGADEFGMKRYALVVLRTGPNTGLSKSESDAAFAGHMANIQRLADAGQLVFAGPLGRNAREYRGIFVFNVEKMADAETLVATDPAVKAGLLAGEVFLLYGSAALQQVNEIHKRIAQKNP
jgi:uncharacterized protein YciI